MRKVPGRRNNYHTKMNQLLTADHRELDVLLERLYSAIDGGIPREIFEKLDIFWARLAIHIRAEHLRLFPAILSAVKTQDQRNGSESLESVKSTLARLQKDHDFFVRELAAAMILARRSVVENNNTAETLTKIRNIVAEVHALLETHNEIEEAHVYFLAEDHIDSSEKEDLREMIRKELDNLPPRFDGDRMGSNIRIYD